MQLGLGTVQFGLDYGVSNHEGRPSEEEVRKILALAGERKLLVLDTAAAYGDSETVLGRCLPGNASFRVVTKTRPLRECPGTIGAKAWIRDGFICSLDRLRLETVDALLAHHAGDLLGPSGGDLYAELVAAKRSGRVSRIGVSAYTGADIDAVLHRYDIDLIQIPLNVFDQRLLSGGQLARLKERAVEVHVRSIFLQGLLLMEPAATPAYFGPIRPKLLKWHHALKARNLTPAQGAFAFARSLDVDVVLAGVVNASQFAANHEDFLLTQGVDLDFAAFAVDDEAFVNPSRWKLVA
jgi:aryl-alcohol dehydrogenase-like predicted oxidoreductase